MNGARATFPLRRSKKSPKLMLKICDGYVWWGAYVNGEAASCGATQGSHRPLTAAIFSDALSLGALHYAKRGLMRPIVEWLRANGVEVSIEPDSDHAPDLLDLQPLTAAQLSEGDQAQERG